MASERDGWWKEAYEELEKYQSKHGDCKVPARYDDNQYLGSWVQTQRTQYKKKKMSEERINMLNAIGFSWQVSIKDKSWNDNFKKLKSYKSEKGNCNMPAKYVSNPSLANWVHRQRGFYNKSELSEERINKLNSIGFSWRTKKKKKNEEDAEVEEAAVEVADAPAPEAEAVEETTEEVAAVEEAVEEVADATAPEVEAPEDEATKAKAVEEAAEEVATEEVVDTPEVEAVEEAIRTATEEAATEEVVDALEVETDEETTEEAITVEENVEEVAEEAITVEENVEEVADGPEVGAVEEATEEVADAPAQEVEAPEEEATEAKAVEEATEEVATEEVVDAPEVEAVKRRRDIDEDLILPKRTRSGKNFSGTCFSHHKGLWNQRNNCYLNASLQVLFSLPDFLQDHVKIHSKINTKIKDTTIKSLIPICLEMLAIGQQLGLISDSKGIVSTTKSLVNPSKLKREIAKKIPEFKGNEQQDAQEFTTR